MSNTLEKIKSRRTFAIISHPDAGKTTITEKLLLIGSVIQTAGSVKGKGNQQKAKSDWMEIEKQRGISVTTSAMQFPYNDCMVNLLDTPGHEDFSEDTYRTLTAVDSALMVIDATKGVEERTIKLMEVTRLRTTPILTFMNKLDRDIRDAFSLLDEVEEVLKIKCCPITWPIGSGKLFKGVYNLKEDYAVMYKTGQGSRIQEVVRYDGINNPQLIAAIGDDLHAQLAEEVELLQGVYDDFNPEEFLAGELTPVFFGTALGNFGVDHMLEYLTAYAPSPLPRQTLSGEVEATDPNFSGFVFKIQANMDPKHRDRVAFMRIVSGKYTKGMKVKHHRIGKEVQISDALTFEAGDRTNAEEAYAGDIIGIHNHGTIQIGDAFSTFGEEVKFTGIPNFAPELFKRIRLKDPLKMKQLLKGLMQLSEEGSVQVFRPIQSNDLIVGAIGVLQFDVVVNRLKNEYNVEAIYEHVNVATARWVECDDVKKFEEFKRRCESNLALDGADNLTYIAPTMVNLNLTKEKYPEVRFFATREH